MAASQHWTSTGSSAWPRCQSRTAWPRSTTRPKLISSSRIWRLTRKRGSPRRSSCALQRDQTPEPFRDTVPTRENAAHLLLRLGPPFTFSPEAWSPVATSLRRSISASASPSSYATVSRIVSHFDYTRDATEVGRSSMVAHPDRTYRKIRDLVKEPQSAHADHSR